MGEEPKESWLNYLALCTVLLALGATLSTLRVGSYSNRSILRQTQASNQWSYFQAKSIKSYLYELQKEKLEVDLKMMKDTVPKSLAADFERKIDSYTQKIMTYDEEKSAIQTEATKLETERDIALRHSQTFGVAVVLLQLSILLSSIAALLRKKQVWYLGLALGLFGGVYFCNGCWLFF
jgi:hypothetical protein